MILNDKITKHISENSSQSKMLSEEGNIESSFWKERDIETKLERGKVKKIIFFIIDDKSRAK